MDPGLLLVENLGRFAAVVGVILATPFFAYAGWLWLSSMGDPNRSASARNSVIGVCVGVVIMGLAFLVPAAVSDYVVAPAGGIEYESEQGVNCDQMLRDRLVANREISDAHRVNYVVQHIQATFEGCAREMWNPVARTTGAGIGTCFDTSAYKKVSGVEVPEALQDRQVANVSAFSPAYTSGRDDRNNVIVHWVPTNVGAAGDVGLPSDGSVCWLYVANLTTWVEGYP